jgi:hypothetical protein
VPVVLAIGSLSLRPTSDLSPAGIPSGAESMNALTLEKGFPPGETEPAQACLYVCT